MKTRLIIAIQLVSIILFFYETCAAQKRTWKVLENSPVAPTRFNDCSFINAMTGWVCGSDNTNIYKTTNGGNNWFVVGSTLNSSRSIVFTDSMNGYAGEYSSENRLSFTTNGGEFWHNVSIPAPPENTGICGWSAVNSKVIYGCGRYWGPSRLVKTTTGGIGWENIGMSQYASGLVDCYFTSEDSGLVVGRASGTRPIVLRTVNGGADWDTAFYTDNFYGWCWKISFYDRMNGFISIEPSGSHTYFLKTVDGGITWEALPFLPFDYDEEGIGFINASTGWIGGWEQHTYETTDGGTSWHLLDSVPGSIYNINRFRFFGDTVGYAVGKRVYKYMDWTITSAQQEPEFTVNDFKLYQNYPNPFNPTTKIKFSVTKSGNFYLLIYDMLGKVVSKLLEDKYLPVGTYEFDWNATQLPSGIYYYKLYSGDFETTRFMSLIK